MSTSIQTAIGPEFDVDFAGVVEAAEFGVDFAGVVEAVEFGVDFAATCEAAEFDVDFAVEQLNPLTASAASTSQCKFIPLQLARVSQDELL